MGCGCSLKPVVATCTIEHVCSEAVLGSSALEATASSSLALLALHQYLKKRHITRLTMEAAASACVRSDSRLPLCRYMISLRVHLPLLVDLLHSPRVSLLQLKPVIKPVVMAHNLNFCCANPRIESPVPPARPSIQTIDSILTTAAFLPEDHPHALNFGARKKPDTPINIIRSPNMADKIRLQILRRRSTKALRDLGGSDMYDGDNKIMNSTEVVNHVEGADLGVGEKTDEVEYMPLVENRHRFGSVRTIQHLQMAITMAAREQEPQTGGRMSTMSSLTWLQPLLRNK